MSEDLGRGQSSKIGVNGSNHHGNPHLFPLPFLRFNEPASQCPPARNRRSAQRRAFVRLTNQTSNLAIAAANALASGKPFKDCLPTNAMYSTQQPCNLPSSCTHVLTEQISSAHADQQEAAMCAPSSGCAAATVRRSASAAPVRTTSSEQQTHIPGQPALQPLTLHTTVPPSARQQRSLQHIYAASRRFLLACRRLQRIDLFQPPIKQQERDRTSSNGSNADSCNTRSPALEPLGIVRQLISFVTHMQLQRNRDDVPMQPSPSLPLGVTEPASPSTLSSSPLQPVHLPGYERAPRGVSTLPSSYTAPAAVVPIIAERIALPSELHAIPLLQLLPPSLADSFSSPNRMLRAEEEVRHLNESKPLPSPRVGGSRAQYLALLKRMHSAGMLAFTAHPHAINGLFAVAKDEHSDRLIIDAQPANRLFVEPQHVSLPNASHLVQLQVQRGRKLFVAKSDLSNFYHHLRLPPEWQPYFCLPPLTEEELLAMGWDVAAPYPMCTTLPMGFSHAVVLAQAVHEHALYTPHGSGVLHRPNNILALNSSILSRDQAVHGLYVDDLFIISTNRALAAKHLAAALAAYATAGLPVSGKKVIQPTDTPTKVIGFTLDGTQGLLYLAPQDALQLLSQTLSVLRVGQCTGQTMAQLVGSWTWCLMMRRPALSILQHAYRFAEVAQRRMFVLWPSVVQELLSLCAVLPLLHTDLHASFHDVVYATDASTLAAGVCATDGAPALSAAMWQFSSSPRFSLLNIMPLLQSQTMAAESGMSEDTLAHLLSLSLALQRAVEDAHWRTLIASRWRHTQHINALELHAVLLALRHHLSSPTGLSTRLLCLVDSAVAFYVLWKGRTSSRTLTPVTRQIQATLLASGVTLHAVWIPSAWNPADHPSRL
jgi:hypothetical protein